MARLGRGRRSGAHIARGRSIPTATPLVRKRLVQTPVANGRAHVFTRVWRRRRSRLVFRARSTPTPTPLVRKRLVQTPVGNDRAQVIARSFRRKRAHFVNRSPQPGPPVPRQLPAVVSRAGWRASLRARYFAQRTARLSRGVSVPTPTPLVRKRVFVSVNGNDRAHRVRFFRRRPRLVLSPPRANPTVVVVVKPVVVIGRARIRAARVRSFFARHQPQIARPPVASAPAGRVLPPLVTRIRRSLRVRAVARRRVRISRSIVAPYRPRAAFVGRSRARQRARFYQPRGATVVRPRGISSPTPRVAPKIVIGRTGRRQSAVVRGYYTRRRAHFETSTLGTVGAPVAAIVTTTRTRTAPGSGLTEAVTGSGLTRAVTGSGLTRAETGSGLTRAAGGDGDTHSSLGGS